MTKRPTKDPKGGLTAAGRAAFRKKDGSHLKPGVKGKADTPEKMKRKGSFLRRHFANLRGPLVDAKGEPTRLALSAHAWGEPVPKTAAAAKKLAEKGTRLLERYAKTQDQAPAAKRRKKTKTVTKKPASAAKKKTTKKKAKKKAQRGLYANIHAAQERAAHGGRPTRKKGQKGAPTAKAFKQAAKTAKS